MTSLTVYGGAGEIGGNKILLEDKGVKVYFDFGESFGFGEDFFYEWLAPRSANGLEVYFEFGLVPKLPKIYSEKMLKLTNLKYEKPDVDAVFISHSHSDHTGHLSFLDESIPVYMGHGTHRVLEVYKQLYPAFVHLGEHENLHLFKSGDKIKIKHLTIEPIHVEHSVPGAYGFIIKTSKGPIVYTGDFRLHGPCADMSREFIRKAAAAKPIALLCEGTRMSREEDTNFTEAEVEKRISSITKASKGIVFVHFSMTNVDRFMSVYHAAVKNKRIMVIDTKMVFVLDNLKDKIPVLPDVLKDKNIKVYYRIAKSCTFCCSDYYKWEQKYMPNMITYKEIKANPAHYLVHLGFYRLMELVYLQPSKADFIYSSSEHFLEGEENEEERAVWGNWMKHFGIAFHKAHCSGHASKQDLIEAIKAINPKVLIPIHTQMPEEFKKVFKNVKIVKTGEKIML